MLYSSRDQSHASFHTKIAVLIENLEGSLCVGHMRRQEGESAVCLPFHAEPPYSRGNTTQKPSHGSLKKRCNDLCTLKPQCFTAYLQVIGGSNQET